MKHITIIKFKDNMIIVNGSQWVGSEIFKLFKQMGYEPDAFCPDDITDPLSDLRGRL